MKEKILKLRADGLTYRQIEKKLGCARSTISFHLGEGQREKSRLRNKYQREKHLSELKIAHGGKCIKCRYDRCLAALHFHHRNPTEKSFTINGQLRSRGWKQLADEAKKCDLLCANCHAEYHNCPDLKG